MLLLADSALYKYRNCIRFCMKMILDQLIT